MFRRRDSTNHFDCLGLTPQECAALDGTATVLEVPSGAVLCRQHHRGRQLVWILDGVAGVERDGQVVGLVESGDVVGEGTMMGARDRCNAGVVALSPLTVAVLSRQDWLAAQRQAPSLVERLFEVVLEREPPLAA